MKIDFSKDEIDIAKDPREAYNYARHMLRGRFKEGEPAILKSKYKKSYLNFLKKIGGKL